MMMFLAEVESPIGAADEAPTAFEQLAKALSGSDASMDWDQILIRLLIAAMIGWLMGVAYRYTHTGKKMKPSMPHTLLLLCVSGCLIWLVVGGSMVRAFGLAGTVGLIRYRTRINDPKDSTILLFSMILGMACGLGQYILALIAGIVVITLEVILYTSDNLRRAADEKRILINNNEQTDESDVLNDPEIDKDE